MSYNKGDKNRQISVLVGDPPVVRYLGSEFYNRRHGDTIQLGLPNPNKDTNSLTPSFFPSLINAYGNDYGNIT